MKMLYIHLVLVTFLVMNCDAQQNIQTLISYNENFSVTDMKAASDGNLYCAFRDMEGGIDHPGAIKLDTSFNIIWASEQQFNNSVDQFYSCTMPDNGITTVGVEDTSYQLHSVITRFDPAGNVMWSRVTTSDFMSEFVFSVTSLPSGNLLACGAELNSTVLMKINGEGNITWKKKILVTNGMLSIQITRGSDNEYYLTGAVTDSLFQKGGMVMKIDSDGNIFWINHFTDSQANPLVSSFVAGSDSSYYFTLSDGLHDTILAVKAIGITSILFATPRYHPHSNQVVNAIALANDGSVLVNASVYDSLQSAKKWGITLSTVSPDGFTASAVRFDLDKNERAGPMALLNNSIYIAGTSTSDDYDSSSLYMIKHRISSGTNCNASNFSLTQPNVSFVSGNMVPFTIDSSSISLKDVSFTSSFITPLAGEICNEVGVEEITSQANPLHVFPNPFQESCVVRNPCNEEAALRIYDMSGRMISEEILGASVEVSVGGNLSQGIYLLSLQTKEESYSIKLVKEE